MTKRSRYTQAFLRVQGSGQLLVIEVIEGLVTVQRDLRTIELLHSVRFCVLSTQNQIRPP